MTPELAEPFLLFRAAFADPCPTAGPRARGPGLRALQVDEHQGKVHLGLAAPGKPR